MRVWGAFLAPILLLVLSVVPVTTFDLQRHFPDALTWVATLVVITASTLTVWWALRRWSAAELGFTPLGRRGLHLFWQVPVAMVTALTATALVAALLGLTPADDTTTESVGTPATALIVLVGYLVLGPVIEEILLRRLTMCWIEDRLNTSVGRPRLAAAVSVLLSSAVFGALHMVAPVMVWTFFLGVGCAILTRWHRSLWGGLALHSTVNLIASAALVPVLLSAG